MNEMNNSRKEKATNHETLKQSPRIEVFGTVVSGAADIRDTIKATLAEHDLGDIQTNMTKDMTRIEDSFFGRDESEKIDPSDTKKTLRKRFTQSALNLVNGSKEVPLAIDTLPTAVVLLPQMRYYNPNVGTGVSLPSPVEEIEELCMDNDVPFIYAENGVDEEFTRSIATVIDQQ